VPLKEQTPRICGTGGCASDFGSGDSRCYANAVTANTIAASAPAAIVA